MDDDGWELSDVAFFFIFWAMGVVVTVGSLGAYFWFRGD